MGNYYQEKLNANGLYQVYQTDIPRIKQYLEAEIDYVKERLTGIEHVLEIGAGYGRIMRELAPAAAFVTGVEISEDSVMFGKSYLQDCGNCRLLPMDAHKLDFHEEFDVVVCLQNGLSSVKGNPAELISRCLSALKPGGAAISAPTARKSGIPALNGSGNRPGKDSSARSMRKTQKTGLFTAKTVSGRTHFPGMI